MFGLGQTKKKGIQTVVFQINGMHCTSCALNIDGELEELDGVIQASTSYAQQHTQVEFDPKKINPDRLSKTISKLGYTNEMM